MPHVIPPYISHDDASALAREVHALAETVKAAGLRAHVNPADLERLLLRVDGVDPELAVSLRALMAAGVPRVPEATLTELRDGLGKAATALGRRSTPPTLAYARARADWLVEIGRKVLEVADPEFYLTEKLATARTVHRVEALVREALALVEGWDNLLDQEHDRRAAALTLIAAGLHLTPTVVQEDEAVKLVIEPGQSGGDGRQALVVAWGEVRVMDEDVAESLGVAWLRDRAVVERLLRAAADHLQEGDVLVQVERHVTTQSRSRVLDLDTLLADMAERDADQA